MREPSFGDIALRAGYQIDLIAFGRNEGLDAVLKLNEAFSAYSKLNDHEAFWCSDEAHNTIFWTQCQVDNVPKDRTIQEVRLAIQKTGERFTAFCANTGVSREEMQWLVNFCLALHREHLGQESSGSRRFAT